MLRAQARIVSVSAGRMRLAPLASGCGSCGQSAGCGTARLAKLLPATSRELELPDDGSRRVGELVDLGLPEGALLVAALLAYLPPLVALVLGAMAITPVSPDLQPLGAAIGTLAGFAASRRLSRAYAGRLIPVPLAPAVAAGRPAIPLQQEFEHD